MLNHTHHHDFPAEKIVTRLKEVFIFDENDGLCLKQLPKECLTQITGLNLCWEDHTDSDFLKLETIYEILDTFMGIGESNPYIIYSGNQRFSYLTPDKENLLNLILHPYISNNIILT